MDLYYNQAKIGFFPISPITTIEEIKEILSKWLVPQGVTNYKIRLFFNNGTELAPIVFESNNYDRMNFISQGNLLNGASLQVITENITEKITEKITRNELNSLKISDLKNILKNLGMKINGNKQELIERILSENKNTEYFKSEDPKVAKIFRDKLEKGEFSFTVLDNGGKPFRVIVKKNNTGKLKVKLTDNTVNSKYPRKDKFKAFVKVIDDVDTIWLGSGTYNNYFNRSEEHYLGNTALLTKNNTCISVASYITEFNLSNGEYVTRYISSVGNSAVPYGWIETNYGYYAIDSFNCDTGFLSKKYITKESLENINLKCWDKTGVFSHKRPIKGLKTLVPMISY